MTKRHGSRRNGQNTPYLPVIRTTYTATVRQRLHALAESNPTPERYERERARILGGNE